MGAFHFYLFGLRKDRKTKKAGKKWIPTFLLGKVCSFLLRVYISLILLLSCEVEEDLAERGERKSLLLLQGTPEHGSCSCTGPHLYCLSLHVSILSISFCINSYLTITTLFKFVS